MSIDIWCMRTGVAMIFRVFSGAITDSISHYVRMCRFPDIATEGGWVRKGVVAQAYQDAH